jgi:glutaredoxin-dependent peroxiredoxin
MALQKGDKAPEFLLYNTEKKPITLQDILGGKIVLAFFPGAFTGVCTKEMCTFRDNFAQFIDLGGNVYGISVDGPAANYGFTTHNSLNFPILSDFTREVSKIYCGVHEDFWGVKGYSVAKRSVFVIDRQGVISYAWITDNPGELPDFDAIKNALKNST